MPSPGSNNPNRPKRGKKKKKATHPFTDASHGVRLQKVLADAGIGSRRACEELIAEGEVTVNGHTILDLPAWVDPSKDHIKVRGGKLRLAQEAVYIMLFKPRGVVCTNDDPEGRTRAIDLVQHPKRPRLYTVGRLDVESSGLILLTNDGELANRLTHPRYEVHKVYELTVEGSLDEEAVRKIERGVFLPDRRSRNRRPAARRTSKSKLNLLKRGRESSRLLLELREGRNRQIRRMMLEVGCKVKKLRRIQLGPIKLSELRPGQWRDLHPAELTALQRAAFRTGLD